MATTLLDMVKGQLRQSSEIFDEIEIKPLIDACKSELALAGIHETNILDTDPLIQRVICVYCKANFGNNPDREKLTAIYKDLKDALALSILYTTEKITDA